MQLPYDPVNYDCILFNFNLILIDVGAKQAEKVFFKTEEWVHVFQFDKY